MCWELSYGLLARGIKLINWLIVRIIIKLQDHLKRNYLHEQYHQRREGDNQHIKRTKWQKHTARWRLWHKSRTKWGQCWSHTRHGKQYRSFWHVKETWAFYHENNIEMLKYISGAENWLNGYVTAHRKKMCCSTNITFFCQKLCYGKTLK
jgi:hypothetical protein